ncbi:hypothetical protein [uncultured Brachyspira sp.]|uniref:hypothetical protein n=1 Tax=uncultured Brachyspira sp. TaxID=221953 RepID=UPI0026143A56|nr:hypothetical protein [uncultured Brachyspira sp.]
MKKIIFIIVLAISSILYSQYYDSYDIGKWNLVEKIDPITDEKEISLYIKAQEQNSLNYNTLYIKITKDSININIYTPSLLFKERFSDDDKIDLIYRLDKNEPRSMILNKYGESEVYSLTDNEITSGRSIVFLKELISSDLLAIRALEQIGSAKHTYTYVYDLKQLRELLLNANFDNTMIKSYESEIKSMILQKQESGEAAPSEENNNQEEKTEKQKTERDDNIYMIDDI